MNERNREGATVDASGTAAQAGSADLGTNSSIGRRLKAFYDDVASEPVPDRFLSLLDALDRAEQAARRGRGGEEDRA